MDSLHARLQKELDRLRRENLERKVAVHGGVQLNLSANDYLNLRSHPDVIAAAQRTAERYGTGSGASPLLSGFLPCHRDLLERLKQWKGKPHGMLFNSGFLANQALMHHLPGKTDLVLADKLVHHSIVQALMRGQAKFKRYRHLDLDHLEKLLEAERGQYETVFVVTESVFSMDGDHPDLVRLAALKEKFAFTWVLDEAHATGVFGPTGGGLAEAMGVLDAVDILVGTLGKALASMGAYVLCSSQTLTDYLTNRAGEFIYSTFLAPAQAGAALAALDIVQAADKQRKDLRALSRWLRERLQAQGWQTPDGESPIVPILVGDADKALSLRDRLLQQGILTGAVRPPTVPAGTARLRVSLHAGVSREQLQGMLDLLGNGDAR